MSQKDGAKRERTGSRAEGDALCKAGNLDLLQRLRVRTRTGRNRAEAGGGEVGARRGGHPPARKREWRTYVVEELLRQRLFPVFHDDVDEFPVGGERGKGGRV